MSRVQVERLSLCLLKDVKRGGDWKGAKKAGGKKARHASRLQLVQLLGACSRTLVSPALTAASSLMTSLAMGGSTWSS